MKQFSESIRRFFEERNQAWITLDTEPLAHVAGIATESKFMKAIRKTFYRKRHAYELQGKKLVRVHTQVKVYQNPASQSEAAQEVVIDEFVQFVYRDVQDFAVESRIVQHEQTWRYKNDEWLLVDAKESNERDKLNQRRLDYRKQADEMDISLFPQTGAMRQAHYNRVAATRYADLWWNRTNPRYGAFADDCTSFICQCLHAGNLPMVGGQNPQSGWWFKFGKKSGSKQSWSYSWSTSNALYIYLTNKVGASLVSSAQNLKMGDLIFYDWDGSGNYHHTTIVTDFDDRGEPLVNAHTDASAKRAWPYQDSRAWTPQTRYRFVHMPDQL